MKGERIRVAVIGAGAMGLRHAGIYRSLRETDLCAVVEVNEARCRRAEDLFHVPGYASVDAMMQRQLVDVVSICAPPEHHASLSLECFEHELDVLLEKPIATSVSAAQKIVSAAKERMLLVGHVERFNPAVQAIRTLMADQALGEHRRCSMTRTGLVPDQACRSVGVLYDLAIHDLDLLGHLFGGVPEIGKVNCLSPSYVNAIVRSGQLEIELCAHWNQQRRREIQIVGSRGRLDVDLLAQQVKLSTGGRTMAITVIPGHSLRLQLEHFVACVRQQDRPRITPLEALRAVQLAAQLEAMGRPLFRGDAIGSE